MSSLKNALIGAVGFGFGGVIVLRQFLFLYRYLISEVIGERVISVSNTNSQK